MAIRIDNEAIATGRAKCRCCGKKITKGLRCIYASGYQASGYAHHNCSEFVELVETLEKELK